MVEVTDELPVQLVTVAVDVGVWDIVDAEAVRGLLHERFRVVDRAVGDPTRPCSIMITVRSDPGALAGFRRRGARSVLVVVSGIGASDGDGTVASVLWAGADYCLIDPSPVELAAHVRALARRLDGG